MLLDVSTKSEKIEGEMQITGYPYLLSIKSWLNYAYRIHVMQCRVLLKRLAAVICFLLFIGCTATPPDGTFSVNSNKNIDGHRYLKVISINGQETTVEDDTVLLRSGRNYIDLECGDKNINDAGGQKYRFQETHYIYTYDDQYYQVGLFSRGYNFPENMELMPYCSSEKGDCGATMGYDATPSVCNVLYTADERIIKPYTFNVKRIVD